jgi:hypothetical protein
LANGLAAALKAGFESMSSRLLDAMRFQINMLDYRQQARERVATGSSDVESDVAEPTEKLIKLGMMKMCAKVPVVTSRRLKL